MQRHVHHIHLPPELTAVTSPRGMIDSSGISRSTLGHDQTEGDILDIADPHRPSSNDTAKLQQQQRRQQASTERVATNNTSRQTQPTAIPSPEHAGMQMLTVRIKPSWCYQPGATSACTGNANSATSGGTTSSTCGSSSTQSGSSGVAGISYKAMRISSVATSAAGNHNSTSNTSTVLADLTKSVVTAANVLCGAKPSAIPLAAEPAMHIRLGQSHAAMEGLQDSSGSIAALPPQNPTCAESELLPTVKFQELQQLWLARTTSAAAAAAATAAAAAAAAAAACEEASDNTIAEYRGDVATCNSAANADSSSSCCSSDSAANSESNTASRAGATSGCSTDFSSSSSHDNTNNDNSGSSSSSSSGSSMPPARSPVTLPPSRTNSDVEGSRGSRGSRGSSGSSSGSSSGAGNPDRASSSCSSSSTCKPADPATESAAQSAGNTILWWDAASSSGSSSCKSPTGTGASGGSSSSSSQCASQDAEEAAAHGTSCTGVHSTTPPVLQWSSNDTVTSSSKSSSSNSSSSSSSNAPVEACAMPSASSSSTIVLSDRDTPNSTGSSRMQQATYTAAEGQTAGPGAAASSCVAAPRSSAKASNADQVLKDDKGVSVITDLRAFMRPVESPVESGTESAPGSAALSASVMSADVAHESCDDLAQQQRWQQQQHSPRSKVSEGLAVIYERDESSSSISSSGISSSSSIDSSSSVSSSSVGANEGSSSSNKVSNNICSRSIKSGSLSFDGSSPVPSSNVLFGPSSLFDFTMRLHDKLMGRTSYCSSADTTRASSSASRASGSNGNGSSSARTGNGHSSSSSTWLIAAKMGGSPLSSEQDPGSSNPRTRNPQNRRCCAKTSGVTLTIIAVVLLAVCVLFGAIGSWAGKTLAAQRQSAAAAATAGVAEVANLPFEVKVSISGVGDHGMTDDERCKKWFGSQKDIADYRITLGSAFLDSLALRITNMTRVTCAGSVVFADAAELNHSGSSNTTSRQQGTLYSTGTVNPAGSSTSRPAPSRLLLEFATRQNSTSNSSHRLSNLEPHIKQPPQGTEIVTLAASKVDHADTSLNMTEVGPSDTPNWLGYNPWSTTVVTSSSGATDTTLEVSTLFAVLTYSTDADRSMIMQSVLKLSPSFLKKPLARFHGVPEHNLLIGVLRV